MIIVKLIGGMGNQMFQYAFARNISLMHNVELKLDLTELESNTLKENFTKRAYELNVFNIQNQIATKEEIEKFKKNKFAKIVDYISLYTPFQSANFYLREPHFSFFDKALKVKQPAYIDGYWHSELYFKNCRKQLLQDFRIIKPISETTQNLATKILKENSIAIHVRKGDYLKHDVNIKTYANCDANYYTSAIDYFAKKIENPTFYIFSDEPQWFENNIKMNHYFEYVNFNTDKKNYEDLYLMKLCKHNIIANSSFSWWGAWLNENENKIIVAPQNWFVDKSKNTKDLLPKTWIKI